MTEPTSNCDLFAGRSHGSSLLRVVSASPLLRVCFFRDLRPLRFAQKPKFTPKSIFLGLRTVVGWPKNGEVSVPL